MPTYNSDRESRGHYWLRLETGESNLQVGTNRSDVGWALYLHGDPGWYYNDFTANAAVLIDDVPVWVMAGAQVPPGSAGNWSGGSGYLLASGTTTVVHDPDGSATINVSGYYDVSNKSPYYVPGSIIDLGTRTMTLTTLRQAPGTPTGLTATRVSDTQASLAWTNNHATNGAPSNNRVQASVNGAAFADVVTVAATTGATVTTAANRKTQYRVNASNSAGASANSAVATLYTTPAAPTAVAAAKDSGANIVVTWTPQVGFAEHEHVVRHGTVVGSVITWDESPLATVASGTSSYTHNAPSPSAQHVYAVFARNTDAGALASAELQSNTVVLLVAPNKPTIPTIPAYSDKAAAFVFPWVHNPVDTTAQTAYEVGYSTNDGSTWSSSGKVTSATPSRTFAANTYTAGQALTLRVRTWGQATTGGSDGTGASPWSDLVATTFKTRPTATIVAPADSSVYAQGTLVVQLGFSQPEAAAFVSATIELLEGATVLEEVVSTTLAGTTLATRVADGGSYSVRAVVRDSNGIASTQVISAFTVEYTEPVAATISATYLRDSGIAQLGLTIPSPGVGEAAAVSLSITRAIDGVSEVVVAALPVDSELTILDTTPTIYGDNVYTVTTVSADGATVEVEHTLTTAEDEWAFMSKGEGFAEFINFGGPLKPQATPTVDSVLVKTAGRKRPIGLYAQTGGLVVSGTGEVVTGLGSSAKDIEDFLLIPGRGCYRDPTGRRMFGQITGQVSRDTYWLGSFTYTVTETS